MNTRTFARAVSTVTLCVAITLLFVAPALANGEDDAHVHHFDLGEYVTAGAYQLDIAINPSPSELLPWEDVVTFEVRVLDHEGSPVDEVRLSYRWEAPPRAHWFSTDYPVVEGTVLAEASHLVRDGRLTWQSPVPIRGTYTLVVEAEGGQGYGRAVLEETVPEDPGKMMNFAFFALILVVFGMVGGLFIRLAGGRTGARTSSRIVILGLAAGMLFLSGPGLVQAHEPEGPPDVHPDELIHAHGAHGHVEQWQPSVNVFPREGRVGRTVGINVEVGPAGEGGTADFQVYDAAGTLQHRGLMPLTRGTASAEVQLAEGGDYLLLVDFYHQPPDSLESLPQRGSMDHHGDHAHNDDHNHNDREMNNHAHDGDSSHDHVHHDHDEEHAHPHDGDDHDDHVHAGTQALVPPGAEATVVDGFSVAAVYPPVDTLAKTLLTLLGLVGIGFLLGFAVPGWIGR